MIAIHQNPLSRLSGSQLIKKLDALVQKEREATLEVIRHVIEFDRRKLYLGIGYGSLFDYCTLHLGFSESAAMRRIKTARSIRDFPEIFGLLSKNQLNLTSVCMLADILTGENKAEILQEARCKSKRQVEAIVARYKPGKEFKDRVRTIIVKTAPETSVETSNSTAPGNSNSTDSTQQNWGKFTTAGGGEKPAASPAPGSCVLGNTPPQNKVLKKKFKLEFVIEAECMKKVQEVKAILSRKYPEGVPLGTLLEEMADEYLDKHSPKRKKQRRDKRKEKNIKKNKRAPDRMKNRASAHSKQTKCNRHIPQAIKDKVYARDKGRCTFVGTDGRRCDSTWNLQIDHIKPFAKGGDHSVNNLRLFCAKHNILEAERVYSKEFMERKSQGTRHARE
jgi:5-methylcytosine-specific restriction endonuclease McrA